MNSIRFELSLARRFMEENKVQTAVIIIGIAIGVSVMVFLTALIDGLQADLLGKSQVFGLNALEHLLAVIDQIHFVNRQHHMANAE